jgi:hypothetical protein
MGYVFYWRRCFKETEGAKPMNIKWELSETNAHLWKESAKMSVG